MSRTVLVTGGARRIGAAIVRVLHAAGHRVAIHHHQPADPDAMALASELGIATVAGDLATADGPARILADARDAVGAIDGLVNCASIFSFDRPPMVDAALFDALCAVNLNAPISLAIALAGQANPADRAVVNVLDQKVANLNPDFFSYSLTKVALEGATTMLAQALAPRVRVNAISPGLSLPSDDQTEAEFDAVATDNLLRRRIALDDIGRTVEFLLTCPAITGQNIFVDNGQRFMVRPDDVMFSTR